MIIDSMIEIAYLSVRFSWAVCSYLIVLFCWFVRSILLLLLFLLLSSILAFSFPLLHSQSLCSKTIKHHIKHILFGSISHFMSLTHLIDRIILLAAASISIHFTPSHTGHHLRKSGRLDNDWYNTETGNSKWIKNKAHTNKLVRKRQIERERLTTKECQRCWEIEKRKKKN